MSHSRIARLKRTLRDVAMRWDRAQNCFTSADNLARAANSIAREVQSIDPNFKWLPLPEDAAHKRGAEMDEYLGALTKQ